MLRLGRPADGRRAVVRRAPFSFVFFSPSRCISLGERAAARAPSAAARTPLPVASRASRRLDCFAPPGAPVRQAPTAPQQPLLRVAAARPAATSSPPPSTPFLAAALADDSSSGEEEAVGGGAIN